MDKILIAAVSRNLCIGKDGKIPWHFSDDMKRFKTLTLGNIVLMGRKTFESLPIRPLKDRTNIVLTRDRRFSYPGIIVAHDIEEVFEFTSKYNRDIFIIGGSEIYRQTLPYAQRLEITEIKQNFDGDSFFPNYRIDDWLETSRLIHPEYDFVTYVKKG